MSKNDTAVTINDLVLLEGLRVMVKVVARVDGEIKEVNSYEGVVVRTPRCDGRASFAVAHRDNNRLSWTNLYPMERYMEIYAVRDVRRSDVTEVEIPGSGGGYYDHRTRGVTQEEEDDTELALLEAGL